MALETVVFQQDPFTYGGRNDSFTLKQQHQTSAQGRGFAFSATSSSSPENGFAPPCPRKRRRNNNVKNREEIEHQRMTHIAVERNRRKQMSDYLALLKSMMPTSYVQRGDQASIIGGAINFVKELEQFLQSSEARKTTEKNPENSSSVSSTFSGFFNFPRYSSTTQRSSAASAGESMASSSSVANVEVTMVESHANLKILTGKHPKQLLKMVNGIQCLGLLVLHLNLTSLENRVLHSFSVKIEENCELRRVNELAAAVYEMVDGLEED